MASGINSGRIRVFWQKDLDEIDVMGVIQTSLLSRGREIGPVGHAAFTGVDSQ